MNREILFRGKPMFRESNEFVYGYYKHGNIADVETDFILPLPEYKNEINEVAVCTSTVGRYTGLTDRNGVKIFEGDIVHYQYEPGKNYWNSDQNSVIKWESTGFYMQGIMGTNKYALSCGWLESIPHDNGRCFEVIGNVYDNPELLKGEENV